MSESWTLIEGDRKRREMSKIVKADDHEFLIGYIVTENLNEAVRKEDLARGRFAAAAPELLAALVRMVNEAGCTAEVARQAREAIAKATGK